MSHVHKLNMGCRHRSPAARRSEPSWKLTSFYPYYRLKYFKPCSKSDFCQVRGGGVARVRGKEGKIVELTHQVTSSIKVVLVVHSRSRALILG